MTNVDIGGQIINDTGSAINIDADMRGGRVFGVPMRDLRGTPTQIGFITGAGNLTDFDISENQGVGCAPIALTGTQTRVTCGRNVGM